jgi:(2Fe-2S) ferredoxin
MSEPPRFPSDAKIPLEEITGATRHLFLCAGPDCCNSIEGEALWNELKAEVRKLSVPVLRTKAACFRICKAGPWLVVYPDGIWYGGLQSNKLRRILREHIEDGRPVREWIAAEMPRLARE